MFWVIAALIVLLFATANLPWQLEDYDQAKQAFTSFEMVKEGRWLYHRTPHQAVATKPPLLNQKRSAIGRWLHKMRWGANCRGEKAAALTHDLQPAAFSRLQSNEEEQDEQSRGYVLIIR